MPAEAEAEAEEEEEETCRIATAMRRKRPALRRKAERPINGNATPEAKAPSRKHSRTHPITTSLPHSALDAATTNDPIMSPMSVAQPVTWETRATPAEYSEAMPLARPMAQATSTLCRSGGAARSDTEPAGASPHTHSSAATRNSA